MTGQLYIYLVTFYHFIIGTVVNQKKEKWHVMPKRLPTPGLDYQWFEKMVRDFLKYLNFCSIDEQDLYVFGIS